LRDYKSCKGGEHCDPTIAKRGLLWATCEFLEFAVAMIAVVIQEAAKEGCRKEVEIH